MTKESPYNQTQSIPITYKKYRIKAIKNMSGKWWMHITIPGFVLAVRKLTLREQKIYQESNGTEAYVHDVTHCKTIIDKMLKK